MSDAWKEQIKCLVLDASSSSSLGCERKHECTLASASLRKPLPLIAERAQLKRQQTTAASLQSSTTTCPRPNLLVALLLTEPRLRD